MTQAIHAVIGDLTASIEGVLSWALEASRNQGSEEKSRTIMAYMGIWVLIGSRDRDRNLCADFSCAKLRRGLKYFYCRTFLLLV